MKFSFIRIPTTPTPAFPKRYGVLAPIIPIRIINRTDHEKYIDINAMIDSGADVCIFPGEIANKIELKIDKERIEPIMGISRHHFNTYLHDIIFEIGGWRFESYACFAFDDIAFPILGRNGFFNLFEIKIDYTKESIELKPKAKTIR